MMRSSSSSSSSTDQIMQFVVIKRKPASYKLQNTLLEGRGNLALIVAKWGWCENSLSATYVYGILTQLPAVSRVGILAMSLI
jgi:hypothetical protein